MIMYVSTRDSGVKEWLLTPVSMYWVDLTTTNTSSNIAHSFHVDCSLIFYKAVVL